MSVEHLLPEIGCTRKELKTLLKKKKNIVIKLKLQMGWAIRKYCLFVYLFFEFATPLRITAPAVHCSNAVFSYYIIQTVGRFHI